MILSIIIISILLIVSIIFNICLYRRRGRGCNECIDMIETLHTRMTQKQLERGGKKVSRIRKAGGYNRKGELKNG